MLNTIRAVTYCVPDLESSVEAFEQWLDYGCVLEQAVPAELAGLWNAPKIRGKPCAVLAPASGEPVFLRLIESPVPPGYAPLLTCGWNAAELHVQDVHGLAERLRESPFRIIGGPRDLLENGAVVALQVQGPGDELLYLTQIAHPGMQQRYGCAESPVGRIFIAVLGATDPAAALDFYRPLSMRVTARKAFNIQVLARAHGLDPLEATFDIASAVLRDRFRVEIDAYPGSALPRPHLRGHLPPGLSMVSFMLDSGELPEALRGLRWRQAPDDAPYFGAQVARTSGAAGEWLELLRPEAKRQ